MTDTRHPTLEVLSSSNIRFFVASRFFSATAVRLLWATIPWHIFEITNSAFYLGLYGLIQFLPVLPMSLIGGAVADAHDRKKIVLIAQSATLLFSAFLWGVTSSGEVSVWVIYTAVILLSVSASFENPARSALLPILVRREFFINAVVIHTTVQNLGWMTGPVLTGFLIYRYGISGAYAASVFLVLASALIFLGVRPPKIDAEKRKVTLSAIHEGISFVRHRSVILASMTLDLFAVIFAGATALLPIFANVILEVGPRGYGILTASLEMGAFLMAIILLVLPRPIMRPGRALLITVVVYGGATILFGLSRSFPLSVAAFAIAGMADQISMVCRSAIVQLNTPDELRGRVSSVNMIFINASNQLGVAESGFLAAVTNVTFSVVAGGVVCIGIVGATAAKVPSLRRWRVDDPAPTE